MSTLIPVVLTLVNLLSMYYIDNACAKKTKFPWYRTTVFGLYTMLLFSTLFFSTDLVSVARNQLYYHVPFMLLWLLLILVYIMVPIGSSMAAIRHIHDKQCANRFGKHFALFLAYFSMVYVLLNIRATTNLQIIDRQTNCAIATY
jgi:uncharacterized membrane protein